MSKAEEIIKLIEREADSFKREEIPIYKQLHQLQQKYADPYDPSDKTELEKEMNKIYSEGKPGFYARFRNWQHYTFLPKGR